MDRRGNIPRWVALVIVALNIETATEFLGFSKVLTQMIATWPNWLAELTALALNKWVLAASFFILGMSVSDYLVRRSLAAEARPGRSGDFLLTYRKGLILLGLKFPRTVGRLIDLRHELRILDQSFASAHVQLPPLPSTDPSNHRGMILTRRYLEVIGSISEASRDEARARANAILAAQEKIPAAISPWQRMMQRLRLRR